ncbi:MAG: MFS transporter [Chloroflexota bacterium]
MSDPALSGADISPADPPRSASPVRRPSSGAKGFGAVLRNRSFMNIWLAQMASQTAQNSLWYVLIVLVANLTGSSPAGIGFTIILVQIPTVLFSSVSGVLVDRVSKRTILVGTNAIRVVGVLAYFLLQTHVGGLFVVTFLVGVISQPFAPAEGSTLPLLVEGDELITANTLFQTTFMASQAVGFAIAPIAIGFLGIPTTLLIIAGLFAFAAVILLPLPAITRRHASDAGLSVAKLSRHVWGDLREVTTFIRADPKLVLALFQIALAPTLLLLLAEVGPEFLTHTLHIGNTGTSLFFLLAPAGVGLGIGITILGQFGARLRKERLVIVALLGLGITVIGLAAVPAIATLWIGLGTLGIHPPQGVQFIIIMAPIAALLGIEVAFINAPVQTIVQERAAPELRGRVLALQQTLTAGLAIPPLIVVGAISSLFGTPATLSMVGLVLIGMGMISVYYA